MKDTRIANIYAKILFRQALESKADLKLLHNILQDIADVMAESKHLNRFLTSPIIQQSCKLDILKQSFRDLAKNNLANRFLDLMIENGKMDIFADICSNLKRLIDESKGKVSASLTIASDMNKKDFDKCILDFEKKLGKKFVIEKKIDPSIAGGMILQFGSNMYDFSIRSLHRKLGR